MKIILSNKYYYQRGGDCIYTIELANLLEELGHEVAVFSMANSKNIKNNYEEYWPSEVDFVSKNIKSLFKIILRPFGSKEVKNKFLHLIEDFSPDIIHLNNIHSQLSPVLVKIASKNKIPVVWTLHDYKILCPSYTFHHKGQICENCKFNSFSVIKQKCIKSGVLASLLGYIENKYWSIKWLNDHVDKFICPSKFVYAKFLEYNFNKNKFIHLNHFYPGREISIGDNNDHKYALYVGRLSYEKGLKTLINAFNKLPEYDLLVIGDGELKNELEKISKPNVKIIGHKSHDEVLNYISLCSFTIIPSEWYEIFGLTILESYAFNKPVLGARIGAITELIIEGKTGFLFTPGNENELIEKTHLMFQFINNNALKNEIKKYYKEFDRKNYAEKMIKIYENILRKE